MDLVFNRYRQNSVAARILRSLASGQPKSAAQVARSSKSRSAANIVAPGGWYTQLRRYGRETRKFDLSKIDGKLVLRVNKRYAGQLIAA